MQYINWSKKDRALVCVKREKIWVKPFEVVSLDSYDVRILSDKRMLPYDNKMKAKLAKRKVKAESKIADSKQVIKKPESKVKAVVEKVVKTVKKKSVPDDKVLRADLKTKLEGMTKSVIIGYAEDILGMDIKFREKKEDIIKKSLLAAKKVGYAKIIKKMG